MSLEWGRHWQGRSDKFCETASVIVLIQGCFSSVGYHGQPLRPVQHCWPCTYYGPAVGHLSRPSSDRVLLTFHAAAKLICLKFPAYVFPLIVWFLHMLGGVVVASNSWLLPIQFLPSRVNQKCPLLWDIPETHPADMESSVFLRHLIWISHIAVVILHCTWLWYRTVFGTSVPCFYRESNHTLLK